MRTLGIFLWLTLIGSMAYAQNYAGAYASGGTTLMLEEDEDGDYIGTFVDDQGVRYEVEGEKYGEELSGFLESEDTAFAFSAGLDGDLLVLFLFPLDDEGEPDYTAAEDFILKRQDGPPPNQINPPANQPTPPPPSPDAPMTNPQPSAFAGTYSGVVNGVATTLTIQQQGATLQGQADAVGYRYTLSGAVNGVTARGRLDDPNTGGGMDVELSIQGDQLTLTLYDAFGQRTPTYFQRGEAAQPGPTPGAANEANVERDPRLVGVWSHQEVMSGGGVSVATQLLLQINADGRYASGDARTVGGGANWSGDTGRSGDVSTGSWRTQGGIIYVKDGGIQWTPYARYTVQGGSLMFTFGDGSTQLWQRQ